MEQPAKRPQVPPGFRFMPSQEELIGSYLNPWITGKPLGALAGVVCLADVYSCDPGALTERFKEFGHDGHWYFLCVARWKAARGARGRAAVMNRVVQGGGYWHCSQRRAVGRQSFEYREADDRKTKWLMEEFSSGMDEAADGAGVKVICKVYLSPRAPPPAKEECQETKAVAGSKRSALHLNAGSEAPPPATVKEERHETKVVAGFKRPALLPRDDVGMHSVAPAPAKIRGAAEAGCSYAAGTSQAAWSQHMLERMGRPVCYQRGVFIKMEHEPESLVMVRANGEAVQFAQTAADGAAMPNTIEAADNQWADRFLSFN